MSSNRQWASTDYRIVGIVISDTELQSFLGLYPSESMWNAVCSIAALKVLLKEGYRIKRCVSIHKTASVSQNFAKSLKDVIPDYLPHLKSKISHIDTSMNETIRSNIISEFCSHRGIAVLTTDGSSSDTANSVRTDSIMLCDPEISEAEVIQTIDRALCIRSKARAAYILVPLFYDSTAPISKGLNFSAILHTLRSIARYDNRLENEILTLSENWLKHGTTDKFSIDKERLFQIVSGNEQIDDLSEFLITERIFDFARYKKEALLEWQEPQRKPGLKSKNYFEKTLAHALSIFTNPAHDAFDPERLSFFITFYSSVSPSLSGKPPPLPYRSSKLSMKPMT